MEVGSHVLIQYDYNVYIHVHVCMCRFTVGMCFGLVLSDFIIMFHFVKCLLHM